MGGGDTLDDDVIEEESSRSSSSSPCFSFSDDDSGFKYCVSEHNFSILATEMRRGDKAYQEILQNQDLLLRSSKRKLRQARNKILSYTPGSFSDRKLCDNDVLKTTSIILVGPKGAGKSSLVNQITRVIEDDDFLPPARAQESFGMHSKGGTYFVEEYMIPRGGSGSFCLYDTRGLSHVSSSDNISMIEKWMTRGVRRGEPVIWGSDSSELKNRLIRDVGTGNEIKVNFVIFVVDAVEIMKSTQSEISYGRMISTAFKSPLLSFKDDKPVVVMTHGDLLSREKRTRARVFLGEIFGIPPDKQIFDIPERRDTATSLTICNLLWYSLEHADKNLEFLPKRNFTISKVGGIGKRLIALFLVFMALASIWGFKHISGISQHVAVAHEAQHKLLTFPNNLTYEAFPSPKRCNGPHQVIRGTNLARDPNPKSESMTKGEPSIDLHIARRLWFDEGKVAKAEPSLDL